MSFIGIGVGISAAASIATAIASDAASQRQAAAASQIAAYNASIDVANATQTQMTAAANVTKQRTNDAAFLSAQRAAYAASGIDSGSGSPMAVLATTAGRQEQDIQQYWANEAQVQQKDYEEAAAGIFEGDEEASMYHLEGAADIFKGIGGAAQIVGPALNAGYTPSDDSGGSGNGLF